MRRNAVFMALTAIGAIGLIVGTPQAAESYRRWRDRTGIDRITGEYWHRYRRAYSQPYYAPTSASIPRRQARQAVRQPSPGATRVSYRWQRAIGKTEDLSSFGSLSNAEIYHLSTFGRQRRETFNRHLKTRLPASVERLENGEVINWYNLKQPEKVYVDTWQGQGENRAYVSQAAPQTKVGLKFDAQGNYLGLGIGQKQR